MMNTFQNCSSLTRVPNIPSSVKIMASTFQGCSALTTAPNIPDGVTNMMNTFRNCTKLTKCSIPLTNTKDYAQCFDLV